jgi:proline iminopeptidase
MVKIKISDTEIYYLEYGSGIPLFVMPGGFGMDHTYLRGPLDPFNDIFKLIYYDYRGHGLSGESKVDKINIEQFAKDNEDLRKELNYDKIGVLGNSAGGYVALSYAIKYPESLKFLILVDTAPAFDYMEEIMTNIQKRNPTPEVLQALNATVSTADECKQNMKDLHPLYFYNLTAELEKKANEIIDNMIFTPKIMNMNDKIFSDFNVVSQLSEIKVPTLILVGKEDFICPPSQAERMHEKIPNSELVLFENSGHYIFFDESEKFEKEIRNWAKKLKF